jgi:hypothetical protein
MNTAHLDHIKKGAFTRSNLINKIKTIQKKHSSHLVYIFYYLLALIGIVTKLGYRQYNKETYNATVVLAKKIRGHNQIKPFRIPQKSSVLTSLRKKVDQRPAKPDTRNGNQNTRKTVHLTAPPSEETCFDEESFNDDSTYSPSTGEESFSMDSQSSTSPDHQNTSNSAQPRTPDIKHGIKLPVKEPSLSDADPTLYQHKLIRKYSRIPVKPLNYYLDSNDSAAFFNPKKRPPRDDDERIMRSYANYTISSKRQKI